MLDKISNAIFWAVIHCIAMTILVSFFMDAYIVETGACTGTMTYLLYQYYKKVHGQKNIFQR